jgi:integrase
LCDDSGLDGHRLHDLRHFMATEMINAGVPVPIVAARLAHARGSTTLNFYAHAVPGGDRDAAVGLAALLDTPPTRNTNEPMNPPGADRLEGTGPQAES